MFIGRSQEEESLKDAGRSGSESDSAPAPQMEAQGLCHSGAGAWEEAPDYLVELH